MPKKKKATGSKKQTRSRARRLGPATTLLRLTSRCAILRPPLFRASRVFTLWSHGVHLGRSTRSRPRRSRSLKPGLGMGDFLRLEMPGGMGEARRLTTPPFCTTGDRTTNYFHIYAYCCRLRCTLPLKATTHRRIATHHTRCRCTAGAVLHIVQTGHSAPTDATAFITHHAPYLRASNALARTDDWAQVVRSAYHKATSTSTTKSDEDGPETLKVCTGMSLSRTSNILN
jgi:hypothetical protein